MHEAMLSYEYSKRRHMILTLPWDKGIVLGCSCACLWLNEPAEMIWLICC